MKLRKIKMLSSKKGYEVAVEKVVETFVMDNFGNLLPKKTTLFTKDPRGNWIFTTKAGKNHSEFILQETDEWVNKTPTEVSESIKQMSPEIVKKYGPNVSYVTLEEALMAFLKGMKQYIRLGEFAIVCEPEVVETVRLLADNGWPLSRIENSHLLAQKPKIEKREIVEETSENVNNISEEVAPKGGAREMVNAAKKKAGSPKKEVKEETVTV